MPGSPPDAVPPPLRVAGVTKRWAGRPAPTLDDVHLTLDPGVVAWLGGDNGAGKTTLLRIVVGLLAPDGGRVRIAGHDVAGDGRAAQRRLGVLPAGSSGLYARLTRRRSRRAAECRARA